MMDLIAIHPAVKQYKLKFPGDPGSGCSSYGWLGWMDYVVGPSEKRASLGWEGWIDRLQNALSHLHE
jgi:hypothetical protein